MSEFVGVLVARGKALHLVDWDRPVWIDPDSPAGFRVVPDPDHIVADALLAHVAGILTTCDPSCGRDLQGLNDLSHSCPHVESARVQMYRSEIHPLAFLTSSSDRFILDEVGRFSHSELAVIIVDQSVL